MNSLNFSNDKHTSFSVLVTAPAATRAALRPVFADEALAGWDVIEAEDLARAQFALQHGYCDVWLVDDRLCRAEEESGLAQFAARQQTPVLLLTDPVPERIGRALRLGLRPLGEPRPGHKPGPAARLAAADRALERVAATGGPPRRPAARLPPAHP